MNSWKKLTLIVLATGIPAFGLGFAISATWTRELLNAEQRAALPRSSRPAPTNAQILLGYLLTLSPEELAKIDLASMNLACASGFPSTAQVDVLEAASRFDFFAERVRRETASTRSNFPQATQEYPEEYWKAFMLISTLQQINREDRQRWMVEHATERTFDQGRGWPEDALFYQRQDTYEARLWSPVLIAAVARRLGYPVNLVESKSRLFCRWEGSDGTTFDFEAGANGIWKVPNEAGVCSLTPAETLAHLLQIRGDALRASGRLSEAEVAYAHAKRLAPSDEASQTKLGLCVDKEMPHYSLTYHGLEEANRERFNLAPKAPKPKNPLEEMGR